MNTKKRFLVSALDWGYGHVTRTSVRVEQLAHLGHEIVVACSPSQFHLWKKLHPEISIHAELPENKITLHGSKSDMLSLMLKYSYFKNNWKQEKNWVSEYVQSNSIDAIISDNRYGFYHSDIPTTLITHQLNLQGPWPWINFAQQNLNSLLNPFARIEIPDFNDSRKLSGKLSYTTDKRACFIGPLSALKKKIVTVEQVALLILSGPEPQRTKFAKEICRNWPTEIKLIVLGDCSVRESYSNIQFLGYIASEEKERLMNKAQYIITRSGYTSLMELHSIEKKALIIPTKGQWEQEYLASYWENEYGFHQLQQSEISKQSLLSWVNNHKA